MKLWNRRFKHHSDVEVLKCSFCNKTQDEVDKLISNPPGTLSRAYICSECIAVCNSILKASEEPISN